MTGTAGTSSAGAGTAAAGTAGTGPAGTEGTATGGTATGGTGTGAGPVLRRPPGRARTVASGLGQLLITVGLVLLLFCVYELWVTNLVTARDQGRLGDELGRAWSAPTAPATPGTPAAPGGPAAPGAVAAPPVAAEPALGDAFARFWVPRVRGDDPLVVVEGVGVADLKKGPGHLPGSALPGAVGNLVMSGHRTTYGAPFADVDRLTTGDALVVETRDTWFTYRMTSREIVDPTAVEVTLPVPGEPGVAPTQAVITLTTCHPRYSARQRMVVHGVLEQALPKTAGRPPALTGG